METKGEAGEHKAGGHSCASVGRVLADDLHNQEEEALHHGGLGKGD